MGDPRVVHYDRGDGKCACRPRAWKPVLTAMPSKVTCRICKKTHDYWEMLNDKPFY